VPELIAVVATDGAPERNRDDRVADRQRRAHVAIELALHLGGVAAEVGARVVVALLEQDDGVALLGELLGGDRAAGAGADDHDVALDGVVAVELGGGGDALHIARTLARTGNEP